MDGFTYILLSVWFAWCQVFASGKLIHACHIHWCSVVEVVVDMLRVPSLWLLLGCVRIVLIRILYSLLFFFFNNILCFSKGFTIVQHTNRV